MCNKVGYKYRYRQTEINKTQRYIIPHDPSEETAIFYAYSNKLLGVRFALSK